MHIHKMNLLLAAIWLAMMAVGVVGDAIPVSVSLSLLSHPSQPTKRRNNTNRPGFS
jgi:hypothetical protein